MKGAKKVIVFETDEGSPEGGQLVIKGDRGTVKVPTGLDPHTSSFSFPMD